MQIIPDIIAERIEYIVLRCALEELVSLLIANRKGKLDYAMCDIVALITCDRSSLSIRNISCCSGL